MPVGRVIRMVGGFCYINNTQGDTIVAVSRGKLKLLEDIVVGDLVDYTLINSEQGVIERVHSRSSILKRPFVSNVTRVAIVFAHKNPDFNYFLLDRFLVMVEAYNIKPLILFNKSDLIDKENAEKNVEPYRRIGYQVICTSTKSGEGKEELLEEISSDATVLAGPSGVGKSALVNMLAPGYNLETGSVSKKIKRGRQTTREVRLLPLPGRTGFIFDTPGFTQLDLDFISMRELTDCFIEFTKHQGECRFLGCLHQQEPGCQVKAAVETGEIDRWRYENFLLFLEELRTIEKRKYLRNRRDREKRR